jgi:hypothetical protein
MVAGMLRNLFLVLQQSPKHPGLVCRFLERHQVVNLTVVVNWHINHLIHSSRHWSLKILKFWEYLEPEATYLDPWRTPTWSTQSYCVRPITLLISFMSETKGGGRFLWTEVYKEEEDLESLLMSIFQINLVQQMSNYESEHVGFISFGSPTSWPKGFGLEGGLSPSCDTGSGPQFNKQNCDYS